MVSMISRSDVNALIPEDVARAITANVQTQSMVMRMARRLPNMSTAQTRVPVLSVLPTAGFVNADGGLKPTTRLAWSNKYLVAEEIAAIVAIPDAIIDDAGYDIWGEIRPQLEAEVARVFDAAVVTGAGAPTTWPQDLVTGATAAGNTIAIGAGGADVFTNVMGVGGAIALVENDGYLVTGHIAAIGMRGRFRGLRDGATGQPIFMTTMQEATRYALDGQPVEFDRGGVLDTSTELMVSGAFDQLVYSIRQDVTYTVSNESVITDNAGNIIYNLFQQDMTALRVVMRVAWQIPNPLNRVQSVEANRYPFAVLTP